MGDKARFPAMAVRTMDNAARTVGSPTRGDRTSRSLLTFKKRLEIAKSASSTRKQMTNCPEMMSNAPRTTPNIARPTRVMMIIERYGEFVHFIRRWETGGSMLSRDNLSIDPQDAIIQVIN